MWYGTAQVHLPGSKSKSRLCARWQIRPPEPITRSPADLQTRLVEWWWLRQPLSARGDSFCQHVYRHQVLVTAPMDNSISTEYGYTLCHQRACLWWADTGELVLQMCDAFRRLNFARARQARDVTFIRLWYGMVWYGAPPTPRQCVLSLRVVASCSLWYGMVWYGAPSTPRQCVPVTEGGGFIEFEHLPDARSLRQAGQSALVRGWVCLCGRWR
jgi:hypothetical protein